MEIMILKYPKISLDTDLKIILLNHQNNYEEISSMISNAAKDLTMY